MRWNIIVESVGEDGKQSTVTLGTIERLAGSTTTENLGAFVKGRRPTDRASVEIITGRTESDAELSKVFAVVRDQDGRAKQIHLNDEPRRVHGCAWPETSSIRVSQV